MTIKKLDPSSLVKGKGLDKKSILYLIVIAAAVIICIGVVYYFSRFSLPEAEMEEDLVKKLERAKIVSQLEELDKQREEISPLPREEIQKQLEELNKLY
ncbi:hypothetical protein KJA13_03550 [Patescibacteria group bacterium]|nr:hypothetical protein [Patescibacteria group bacterium]